MKNKLRAVIFDLDGVLVDSVTINHQSFKILLAEYGVDYDLNTIHKYSGNTLEKQVQMWNEDFNLNINFAEFQKKSKKQQMELVRENLINYLELKEFIEYLKKQNILIGVGTSSSRNRAEELLKIVGVYDLFEIILTHDDVIEHKPNPQVYLEVASKLKVNPKNCIVIEDSSVGIKAGKNANMKVAGCAVYNKFFDSSEVDIEFDKFDKTLVNKFEDLL